MSLYFSIYLLPFAVLPTAVQNEHHLQLRETQWNITYTNWAMLVWLSLLNPHILHLDRLVYCSNC